MEPSNYRERSPPAGVLTWPKSRLVADLDDASALAQAIVDTIRDPLLVLDQDLRVVTANRTFHQTFRMSCQDIQGRPVYGLGDGQWDIPELRLILEEAAPQRAVMEAYEVERNFPAIGRRSMLLNAREVFNQRSAPTLIFLTIEDVTERRAAERESRAATARLAPWRANRDRPLSLSTVRDPGSLDDGHSRPISLKVQAEGGAASSAEAVEHRPHCHRTCDQCIQACLCRRPGRRPACRCL